MTKKIALVGFGFCGRLLFYHLVKNSIPNAKIFIFDKSGQDALGSAFTKFNADYILNVPAIKMSAFLDEPKSFCKFLEKKYPKVWRQIGEDGFAPRQFYGEYLQHLTSEAFGFAKKNGVEFEFVAEEIVEIRKQKTEEFNLKTKTEKTFQASQILLATSFEQSDLPLDSECEFNSESLVKKLWQIPQHQFHHQNLNQEKICIIGSGLSAIDVIVGLKKRNFTGKIFVISRHGNLPQKHFAQIQQNPNFISVDDAKKGVIFLCLKIRNFLQKNPHFDLRHVVDSIRPLTKNLWQNFDQKNQKLFLRFLPYWNIFRHRAPATSIEVIEKMLQDQQLEIKEGALKKITEKSGKIFVQTLDEKIECNYVINCLGFQLKPEKYRLLKQMLTENLLKKDLLLVQSNHPKIHLVGGLNLGRDFECTSVPDMRLDVVNTVSKLLA